MQAVKQTDGCLLLDPSVLSPISCRQDSNFHNFPWLPESRWELSQRRSSQETTWGKIKGTREAHQDYETWDTAHTRILSATKHWSIVIKSEDQSVRLSVTPCTVSHQAPPSMGFSRQGYWSRLPFPSPGDLPDAGIEPGSPALGADALPSEPPGK